jgi:hypothetical protein
MSGLGQDVKRRARRALSVAARPTYRRSLSFVMARDELPHVLNARGLLGVGVEVGVMRGEYSEMLLRSWRGRRLISVDSWPVPVAADPDDPLVGTAAQERYIAEAHRRLAPFGTRSEIRRADSLAAAAATEPGSLDFVYIDADHEYESVRADIEAWQDRIRPGGVLCGHDYYDGWRDNAMYGVARAVDEFCAARGLQVKTTLREHPEKSWFVSIPEEAG